MKQLKSSNFDASKTAAFIALPLKNIKKVYSVFIQSPLSNTIIHVTTLLGF